MKYSLKNKNNFLREILGNIDQLNLDYCSTSSISNSSKQSNLLIGFNDELLQILDSTCYLGSELTNSKLDMEFITSNLLKIELTQKFVKNFSYIKVEILSDEMSTLNSTQIASTKIIYPENFLDYENVFPITTNEVDIKKLVESKLCHCQIANSNNKVEINNVAARVNFLPSYIKYMSVLNADIDYDTQTINIDFNGIETPVMAYYDKEVDNNKYLSSNKAFTIINDSTVNLKFLFYIDLGELKYLIDKNDININYHINPIKTSTITISPCTLTLYEKINKDCLYNGKNVYLKDVYLDEIVYIGKTLDIDTTNNDIILETLQCKFTLPFNITNIDQFVLYKTYDLSNFNKNQNHELLKKWIDLNYICFDEIEFTLNDFELVNYLY